MEPVRRSISAAQTIEAVVRSILNASFPCVSDIRISKLIHYNFTSIDRLVWKLFIGMSGIFYVFYIGAVLMSFYIHQLIMSDQFIEKTKACGIP